MRGPWSRAYSHAQGRGGQPQDRSSCNGSEREDDPHLVQTVSDWCSVITRCSSGDISARSRNGEAWRLGGIRTASPRQA